MLRGRGGVDSTVENALPQPWQRARSALRRVCRAAGGERSKRLIVLFAIFAVAIAWKEAGDEQEETSLSGLT
jgi:hypothetical protein